VAHPAPYSMGMGGSPRGCGNTCVSLTTQLHFVLRLSMNEATSQILAYFFMMYMRENLPLS
jgi:hypothetical protein